MDAYGSGLGHLFDTGDPYPDWQGWEKATVGMFGTFLFAVNRNLKAALPAHFLFGEECACCRFAYVQLGEAIQDRAEASTQRYGIISAKFINLWSKNLICVFQLHLHNLGWITFIQRAGSFNFWRLSLM